MTLNIKLKNLAFKGTRLCMLQYQYPFELEIEYHKGKEQYMIEIYWYKKPSLLKDLRTSQDLEGYDDYFEKDLIKAIQRAEIQIKEHFGSEYEPIFEKEDWVELYHMPPCYIDPKIYVTEIKDHDRVFLIKDSFYLLKDNIRSLIYWDNDTAGQQVRLLELAKGKNIV
jgi:hypothetical protein